MSAWLANLFALSSSLSEPFRDTDGGEAINPLVIEFVVEGTDGEEVDAYAGAAWGKLEGDTGEAWVRSGKLEPRASPRSLFFLIYPTSSELLAAP
jgi:hypothetical protein